MHGQCSRGDQSPAQLPGDVVSGKQGLDQSEELQHTHVLSLDESCVRHIVPPDWWAFIPRRGLEWLGSDPDNVVDGPQRIQLRSDVVDLLPEHQVVRLRVELANGLLLLVTAADDQHARARFGPDRTQRWYHRFPHGGQEDIPNRTSFGDCLGFQSPGGEFSQTDKHLAVLVAQVEVDFLDSIAGLAACRIADQRPHRGRAGCRRSPMSPRAKGMAVFKSPADAPVWPAKARETQSRLQCGVHDAGM